MSISRITELFDKIRTSFGDGIVTASYLDDNIEKGNIFSITLDQAFTADTPIYFTSEYATPSSINKSYLLPIILGPDSGTAVLNIYEDTGYTGGTALTPVDRNRETANTANITVLSGATGTTLGTLLFTYKFGTEASSHPAGSEGGGVGSSSNSIILNLNKKYLYSVETSETTNVGIISEFAEL